MPISKEQLSAIIANKAAALCRPEYDNTKAKGRVNEGYVPGGPNVSDYDADAEKWDRMFSDSAGEDYDTPAPQPRDIMYSQAGAARSQMPDAIKKSMMENKIDVSGLGNSSVLDTLGIKGKPTTAPTQRRQVVTEQQQPMQYIPPTQPVGGGVDYSIIKAIVSECIREYFSKQPLNESAIKTIALKNGTISLVDNKGDIYKAKLEKVGNTKQKNGE